MFCPECGNPLSEGQRFCPRCGTPVEGIGQPVSADVSAESNGQPVNVDVSEGSAVQPVNTGVDMESNEQRVNIGVGTESIGQPVNAGIEMENSGQPVDSSFSAESGGQPMNAGDSTESVVQPANVSGGADNIRQSMDNGGAGTDNTWQSTGNGGFGMDNTWQSTGNGGFGADNTWYSADNGGFDTGKTQIMGNMTGSSNNQQGAPAGGSTGNTGGAKGGNMDMVMRIACGVFAVFFLISALTRIPAIFSTIFNLRIVYFLSTILGFAAAIVMTLSTAASAWKWSSKLKDLVFGGAVLGVLLRLLSLILLLVANLITYRYFVGGKTIFYWLGYVLVAAVLFGLMYATGCAPILGETQEELKNNISAGFSELSGAAKDIQKKQAEKSAAKQQSAAAYQAPPVGGAGYQANPAGGTAGYQTPPPAGGAGYQANPAGNAAGYQAPPAGGTPGYGVPPMGGVTYGMPTGPARGTVAKKTDRSIWIYILLSLVTCGIYSYYFVYKLAEDVNDICEGDGESTSGIVAFILLGLVTCGIYTIIWWYKLANRLQANGPRYNVPIQENGTTYVMWVLFGALLCGIGPFIALNFVIKNTNKLCTVYNQYNGLR